ncbi:alpha/beta hydrolase [Paenibacillus sp. S-38]|uniref:alpha/beta hydrolase n=1 Tax=Paenibacillus sp. S-38 TaxID=3416710 RepID=UPI003CE9919E
MDCRIHIDRMPAADSSLKVILIHGAGGHGRLLAPYARMLQIHGYEAVAPDFPPYGLSDAESVRSLSYRHWLQILTSLIDRETDRDGKPVILLGVSIGGMLAYHAACMTDRVKGLIATTFVDTSNPKVRDQLAPNKLVSRVGKRSMDAFPLVFDPIRIPIHLVSRMESLTNNSELTALIMEDPQAAGIKIPVRFLRTFLDFKPLIEPEHFDRCPVLLIHPEKDPMTPFSLSESFYRRLQGAKQCVLLEGAGHLPIEQPGLDQMKASILSFLGKIEMELRQPQQEGSAGGPDL